MDPSYILIQDNFPELPDKIEYLYLDTETTSLDDSIDSLNPWQNCWVAGVAFTWDDHENIYFIPLRYCSVDLSDEQNANLVFSKRFLAELFSRTTTWVNHNVKYDYHVLANEGLNEVLANVQLFCTLAQAKLVSSDRFKYSEDSLAADWLDIQDVDQYLQRMQPYIKESKDWGTIPIRLIFPYACHDVQKVRWLHKYILEKLHPDVAEVSKNETLVTKCLIRAEQVGLCIDELELKKSAYICTAQMNAIYEHIRDEYGIMMKPNSNDDCLKVLHGMFGLPIVEYTDEGKPSYDKYALDTLKKYPGAPVKLIDLCLKYRKLVSHNGFVQSYRSHSVKGVLHSSYNQVVRTGRMSCKEPNMMQLNKPAKKLIHPPKGRVFLSFDFSAIEFRLLAHYLGQPEILEAYLNDPDTDFHQWVADMCHVKRKPAKNINFCMAYGGGKKKVLSMLATNPDIIAEIEANTPEEFEELCRSRANSIFDQYHRVLHNLRPLTNAAANRLKARGYVRNAYGRHRHLPMQAVYRALNTVIQSTAADVMKEAVIKTSPLFNDFIKDHSIEQVAFVHDEILFTCPKKYFPEAYLNNNCVANDTYNLEAMLLYDIAKTHPIIAEITRCMTECSSRFTVPIRVSAAIGLNNWADLISLPKELTYGL